MNNGVYKNRQLMAGSAMGAQEYAQMTAGGAENIIGLYEWYQGEKMKKELRGVKNPRYKEIPEMRLSRLRAEQNAQSGFTPAETSVFFQNLAKLSNQNYNKAVQAGGSGGSVNAAIGYNKLGALNQFAGQDASLHRQNIQYADSFERNLQLLKNMNTQLRYREHREDVAQADAMVSGGTQTFVNGFATAGGAGADTTGVGGGNSNDNNQGQKIYDTSSQGFTGPVQQGEGVGNTNNAMYNMWQRQYNPNYVYETPPPPAKTYTY